MNRPRLFKRTFMRWHTLHKATTICVLVSLLVGLIPPPLVSMIAPEVAALLPAPSIAQAAGNVTGNVFQDLDADGIDDGTGEPGVQDVTVTAYDATGTAVATATSDSSGNYTLSLSAVANNTPLRIEFTTLPTGFQSSPFNSTSGASATSVRFVTALSAATSNINFGIYHPADYVSANPLLASPRYFQMQTTAFDTLLSWSYSNRGLVSSGSYVAPTGEATDTQIGTTWGLAYRRTTKDLFAAAFLRRHGHIPDVVSANGTTAAASDNVADLGVIYRVTQDGSTANNTNYRWVNLAGTTDVNGATIDVGTLGTDAARGINTTGPSNDPTAYDAVGKRGLGDIDISDDESNIWAMNLNQRKLHAIAIQADGTAGSIRSFDIPTAQCNGVGASNDTRPFAIKYYRSAVYVGLVCSGENTQSLATMNAYVFRLPDDGVTTTFTQVLTFSLGYARQSGDSNTGCVTINNWKPWFSTFPSPCFGSERTVAPAPILSDIEFDVNGDMILGVMDRFGHQVNLNNYGITGTTTVSPAASGDILRAPLQGSNVYAIETTATDASISTEYYTGDKFTDSGNGFTHLEITVGGLALAPGRGEVVSTAYDPIDGAGAAGVYISGGVIFLSNSAGTKSGGYQTFRDTTPGTVGKAGGMGDLELLSAPAPIEIGNRVWRDADSDGIQDPGEAVIAGVVVGLYNSSGTLIETVTTDSNGNYLFSNASGTDATGRNYGVNLQPNTAYTLAVLDSNFNTGSPLNGLAVTVANSQGNTSNDSISDVRDSDGVTVTVGSGANLATRSGVNFTAGGAGANNHSFDFGFAPTGTIQIVKNTVGGNGTFSFTSSDATLDAVSITTVGNTGNSGTPFTNYVGSYTISEDSLPAYWSLTGLSCTGDTDNGSLVDQTSRQVTIDLDASENIVCTFTNTYTPPGAIQVTKQVVITDGSSPTVSGNFTINVDCGGASVSPSSSQTVAAGASVTFSNIAADSLCTVSENTSNLPTAPAGYGWAAHQVTPSQVTISSGQTTAVTAKNTLAPQAMMSGILTVTKTISGTGSGPFNITVNGPSGYISTTTINGGQSKVFTGLVGGTYTVTESTPAGWTTIYTATPGTGGSNQAVVSLQGTANTATLATTPISGKVFRDFNSDGLISANGIITDTGVSGVTVTAYDKNGAMVGSATSGANGTYTINPTAAGPYRVVFSNLPADYYPTTHSSQNGTTVQFVTTAAQASNVNLGVNIPCTYCQDNPRLASISTAYGTMDQVVATVNLPFLFNTTYFKFNESGNSKAPVLPETKLATRTQLGSLFGLAYHQASQNLLAGAFVRGGDMPLVSGGNDAVYRVSLAGGTPQLLFKLSSLSGGAAAGSGAASNTTIGFTGLGGLELSRDGQTLYVINLANRALYAVPLNTTVNPIQPVGTATGYVIPTPSNCNGYTDSRGLAALALGTNPKTGKLYAGLTCTAMQAGANDTAGVRSDLRIYVYEFDPATNTFDPTPKIDQALDYDRCVDTNGPANCNPGTTTNNQNWGAWGPIPSGGYTYPQQPWLSDIAFNDDDMILGLRSRLGDLGVSSLATGGETLRACATGASTWTVESSGQCGGRSSVVTAPFNQNVAANLMGPGSPQGEWYWDDDGGEGEAPNGGLASLGAGLLFTTQTDGLGKQSQAGFYVFNHASGKTVGGGNMWPSAPMTKGNSMGDIELLCDPAPIEVGNRVWDDLNGNGIQDPGEPGISGIQVSLQGPTTTVQTTTDSNGNYYFNNLKTSTAYTITMNVPAGYSLTAANQAALSGAGASSNHPISDTIDSDAVLISGKATIYYTTGGAGENNQGLDFGFAQPMNGQVDILNIAPSSVNTPTATPTTTPTSTPTNTPVPPTATPTNTATNTPTNTPVVPTATPTDTPTNTPVPPTATPTNTPVGPTATSTDTPVGPTDTPTNTPVGPTSTPTNTPVGPTATPTNTPVGPTATPTNSPVGPTATPTHTPVGPTATPTNSPVGPTATPTNTPVGPTATPTNTPVGPTATPTNTPVGPTSTPTNTPVGPTATPTNTPVGPTATPTNTPVGPTATPTNTPVGPTATPTNTPVGPTTTPTNTPVGPTATPTNTPVGPTATPTHTPVGPTATPTNTPVGPTATPTNTPVGPTATPTTTPTATTPPRVSIGNQVWQDDDNNGVFDSIEKPIPNLLMELWVDLDQDGVAEPQGDDAGQTPLMTTTTASGTYSFTNLLPGGYFVRIPNPPMAIPLSSFPYAAPDDGVDNNDNGRQPGGPATQVYSSVIELAVGEEPGTGGGGNYDYTVDFGLVDPFIGNLVWFDQNDNGLVDVGEPGIPNVTLYLLRDANDNGVIDPDETTPERTTATDPAGLYAFMDIGPGTYQVVIPASNFAPGQPLALYPTSSTPTNSSDDQTDEDDNGLQASPALTVTGPLVSLSVDGEPINSGRETGRGNTLDDGDDNNGDMTIDFGFHAPLAQFGDRVWIESDTDGLASTGVITPVAGMTITATDGATIYTTMTTAQGYYSFTVPAGTYTITYGAVPASYGRVTPSSTPGGNTESGNAGVYAQTGNPDQSHVNDTTVTVDDSEANWFIDFAFHKLVQIGNRLWVEDDSDGDATTGTVTPVTGQLVTAISSNGTVYTATTDANGLYTITVPANDTYTVTTGTPAGTVPSAVIATVGNDGNAAANDNKNHLNTGTPVTVTTQDNFSVDFGFHVPMAQFGDRVWIESDTDGLASTGVITPVAGMVITATDGTNVYTMTTNAQGYYSFTVPTGTYTVTYGSVPASYGTVTPSSTPGGNSENGNAGLYEETGNPDQSHVNDTTVTVADSEANWFIDFGFHAPLAQFGDRVWIESDTDGLANTGSITPVAGMVITATDGATIYTTMTTAQGYYSFTVPAGTYTITYGAVPASYGRVTPSSTPGGNTESGNAGVYAQTGNPDQSHANGTTVTVANGEANWFIDFAFHTLVQIGNRLWVEDDSDGDATTGTVTPVTGQLVTAISSNGTVYTATTDANGLYTITVPANDVYTVTTSTPAGTVPSMVIATVGNDGNAAANDNKNHLNTGTPVTVTTQNNFSIDFGFHAPLAQFGDRVWIESDTDGLANTGVITPVAGMLITATDGATIYTTTTTAQGYYSFTVPAGTYTVTYGSVPASYGMVTPSSTPGGNSESGDAGLYEETGNPDQSHVNDTTVTVADSEANWFIDFAFHKLVQIGNRLWIESDTDGDATTGTVMPVAGQVVTATSSTGTVYTDTTDANGYYTITVPANDVYTVTTGTPTGTTPSVYSGTPGNDQSHTPSGTTVTVGTTDDLTIDFGFHAPLAQFGDRVWIESDTDGLADTGSITPVAGMVITATDGTNVYTMTTNAQGYYSFTVPAGTYTVTYGAVPASYGMVIPSSTPGGNSENGNAGLYEEIGNPDQSHVNGTTVTVGDGQANWHVDFAFHRLVQIGNQVWQDDDNNGVFDSIEHPIPNLLMELWVDLDDDGVAEPQGDDAAQTPLTTTTTASGTYSFTNLLPGGYFVRIPNPPMAIPLSSFPYEAADDGVDNNDNGRQPGGPATQVYSSVIELAVGEEPGTGGGGNYDYTVDFGLVDPFIGNLVWFDQNDNGLVDVGEPGIPNVILYLLRDANDNGVIDPNETTPERTTATDPAGLYAFMDIGPGTYQVIIPASNFAPGQPLALYPTSSTPTNSSDDQTDEDDNGLQASPALTVTGPFVSLSVDGEPSNSGQETGRGNTLDDGDDNNGDMTIDFGFHARLAQFGDRVWIESDTDGLASTGSITPVAGMVITVTDGTNVYTMTTNAQGYYSFTVPTGTYTVTYGSVPASYGTVTPSSTPGGNSESGDAGLYEETGKPDQSHVNGTTVTVDDGEANWHVDFAFHKLVQIGNRLWIESDTDGDATTGTVMPVTAQLVTATSSTGTVYTATTDANGYYTITVPANGTYTVSTGTPAGTVPSAVIATTADDANAAANDNKNHLNTGTPVTVTTQNNFSVDFGFHVPVPTATPTPTPTPTPTNTPTPTPSATSTSMPTLQLGNLVWYDRNNNGQADTGEPGIPGVTVQLFPEGADPTTATPLGTQVTDANGNYLFVNLPSGRYFVYIPTPPVQYPLSSTVTDVTDNGEDNDDNGIQDVPGAPVRSPIIELVAGTEPPNDGDGTDGDLTEDFGFYQLVDLGNLVWYDRNNNGQVDTDEPGILGVTVQLFPEGADPTTATPLGTQVTDANGNYLFANLLPGRYFVYIPTPPMLYPVSTVPTDEQDNGEDSDDNGIQPVPGAPVRSPVIELGVGEEPINDGDDANGDLTVDFGFFAYASLGDRVWFDTDKDGIQDAGETGVAGVVVTLYDGATNVPIATTTTNTNGNYRFDNLVPRDYFVEFVAPAGYSVSPVNQGGNDASDSDGDPSNTLRTPVTNLTAGEYDPTLDLGIYLDTLPASIGDTVWFDKNKDGIQDAGETGVPGVMVELHRSDGTLVATTTTNNAGTYRFDNLVPGDYYLVFVPPAGYQISPVDVGSNDAVDSDMDPATGRTPVTTLTPGEQDLSWDLGLNLPTEPASIGDIVWFDKDANGVQDSGETGVPGVLVTPYTASGTLLATAVTNADGHYEFNNLVPGDYYLGFTPPTGYISTLPNMGSNDAIDSDGNPYTGLTAVTTLDPGEHDMTWDYGVYIINQDRNALLLQSAIGNQVWHDLNQNGVIDNGEPGVPNVVVNLYNMNNVLISTDLTDANGDYFFPNLFPAGYYIEFVLPNGYIFTQVGSDPNLDNDSNVNPTTGRTEITVLVPGEVDPTWDAGIYLPSTDLDEEDEPDFNLPYRIFMPTIAK